MSLVQRPYASEILQSPYCEGLTQRGRYIATCSVGQKGLAEVEALRQTCFGAAPADPYDQQCLHVAIRDSDDNSVVGSFRMQHFSSDTLRHSYSARFYDLSALAASALSVHMLEIGRFCIDPDARDMDILRLAWSVITREVDASGTQLLFGCTSFVGNDPGRYKQAFALLQARYLAPVIWRPGQYAREFVPLEGPAPDAMRALAQLPPLLRSYLKMGGKVSDHAVIDRQMNTLHVFTGVEVNAIPPARKRLLRLLA